MTKIENSYVEKLGEVLYDEKKAINYKMVSVMLGVHVNIAKQMLYHVYTKDKKEGRQIYATYLISGMVTGKVLSSINGNKGGIAGVENLDAESYLVMLCRDKDLEEYKANFTRIFSIHVYSLTAFPLENYDVLERLVENPLVSSEGLRPVDFGPISCKASQNLLQNARVPAPIPVTKVETKGKPNSGNEKSADVKNKNRSLENKDKDITEEKEKSEPSQPKSVKKGSITVGGKKDGGNQLKSMFANAAAKPKQTKVEKVVNKPDPKPVNTSSSKHSSLNPSAKNKNEESTRKRKRIQDILDSESEDEEKQSDVEIEDSLPESPIPRRNKRQIESDSEHESDKDKDDDIQMSKVSEDTLPISTRTEDSTKTGRRKVAKIVDEQYNDGKFMVTHKKHVMLFEDEDSSEAAKTNIKDSTQPSATIKHEEPTKSAKTNKSIPPKILSGKTKQQSLMSFFKKK